ncbi:unnamed protein product [Caenorhabditis sp. 36 PRJEB53466]|nr:unnamed protein product [Caenorhabditis sp. 36 PRJEB53466]
MHVVLVMSSGTQHVFASMRALNFLSERNQLLQYRSVPSGFRINKKQKMGKKNLDETANESVVSEAAGDATLTTEKDEYQAMCELVNPIAQPLANRKLAKKVYKLIKKASLADKTLREGIKDVQKELRRNEKGICILAGNVTPIDVYSHIPAICEEKQVPYVYIPSREQLGLAVGHRRPSILIYVKPSGEYQELYDELAETLLHLTVDAA